MKIKVIDKYGTAYSKSFTGKVTMPQVMRLLHYARRTGYTATIETPSGVYTLNGNKLAKL